MINQEKLAEFIANPPEEYLQEAQRRLVDIHCYDVELLNDHGYENLLILELEVIYMNLVEQKQIDDHLANEWLGE